MSPDKERKETLTVDVIMDENLIPESINWRSTQKNDKREEASAALMYFWNAKNKETFNLDLWTKKMSGMNKNAAWYIHLVFSISFQSTQCPSSKRWTTRSAWPRPRPPSSARRRATARMATARA